jgi:hypothetical protein
MYTHMLSIRNIHPSKSGRRNITLFGDHSQQSRDLIVKITDPIRLRHDIHRTRRRHHYTPITIEKLDLLRAGCHSWH